MTTSTKSEIISAIGKTDDHNLKMILLLMLGIMEEIGGKIDKIYTDKQVLRDTVLNGHADIHHDDHEWIKKHRQHEVERTALIDRARPLLDWAEARKLEEEDNKKAFTENKFKVLGDIASKLVWLVLGMGMYAAGAGWPGLTR